MIFVLLPEPDCRVLPDSFNIQFPQKMSHYEIKIGCSSCGFNAQVGMKF